jgi:hypothetical protein
MTSTLVRSLPSNLTQIIPNSPLQPPRPLADQVRQVLEVVAGRDAELADEVLGRALEVAVVLARVVLLGAAEVRVGRDGAGALEPLQALLGLGLRVRVEGALAEELVRRDGLLLAEFGAGVFLLVVWRVMLVWRAQEFLGLSSSFVGTYQQQWP